jgi:hypothetical protein
LQELLGRLNDLAVAAELDCRGAARWQGSGYRDWLAAKSESLLPEFRNFLNHFQQQQAPW